MSWEIFKQNVLRVANNPQSINDIDIVAETYANEYDAAVKRGNDLVNLVSVKNGNVEAMKQIFKAALQKGLSSNVPYDLVGEMGQGVIAYWTGATLNEFPIPTIPAIGATQNIGVTSNIVINPGTWAPAVSFPSNGFQLTPEARVEYEVELEGEIAKYEIEKVTVPQEVLVAREDKISNIAGVLLQNEEYRVTIPYTKPIPTAGTTSVTITGAPILSGDDDPFEESDLSGDGRDIPLSYPTFPDPAPTSQGSGSIGPNYDGEFKKSIPLFPGGATMGEKAVIIALTDLNDGVVENPKGSDSGHPRITQIQSIAGAQGCAWCACAVATWWQEAGFVWNRDKDAPDYHPNRAYVPTWWDWAAKTGRLIDIRNGLNKNFIPKIGDAVIYGWDKSTDHRGFDHIGLVAGFDEGGSFYGIDGNWSSGVSYNRTNKKAVRGFVII
jgi:hypothetical protein